MVDFNQRWEIASKEAQGLDNVNDLFGASPSDDNSAALELEKHGDQEIKATNNKKEQESTPVKNSKPAAESCAKQNKQQGRENQKGGHDKKGNEPEEQANKLTQYMRVVNFPTVLMPSPKRVRRDGVSSSSTDQLPTDVDTPHAPPNDDDAKAMAEARRLDEVARSNAVLRKVPMKFSIPAQEWIVECHTNHQKRNQAQGMAPPAFFHELKKAGIANNLLTEEHSIKGMNSVMTRHFKKIAEAEEEKRKEEEEKRKEDTMKTAQDRSKDVE